MSIVSADISMSLDGYVTGPDPSRESGLGTGGEAIQQWVFRSAESPEDREVLERGGERAGAVVMGRRTFDFVDGPNGWDDTINYAYDHDVPEQPPVVVVTHSVPEETRHAEGFTFVTAGIDAAVSTARQLVGDREVVIMGSGTRLFDLVDAPLSLRQADVVASPHATHLSFDAR